MPTWLPDLGADTAAAIALVGAAVAVLSLVGTVVALRRTWRLRRAWRALRVEESGEDVVAALGRQAGELERLHGQVQAARRDVDELRGDVGDALRHVAVVRYDAFGDMGGRMSFSAAILDDAGDGVVLSSIVGRSDARTYAKGVKRGRSDQQLSDEERQAVAHARRGAGAERR